MKLYNRCQGCKKYKFFIRKRKYTHKIAGEITSQAELCGKCYRNIKKMIV